MRGEHNFPAAENFAHINITKWFGGKTVEKFNKYPSQAVYVQHCALCVCVWYLLKNKKESRYLLSTVYSYKKSTVSIKLF